MTDPVVSADPSFRLPILPRLLFSPRRWWLYVLVAAALSLAGAAALSYLVHLAMPDAVAPDLGGGRTTPALLVFLIAVASPIVETLVMSGPLLLFDRFAGPRAAVVMSAALWGVLHSLAAPSWGLAIWWPFLIFSTAFLVWRRRGYWRAVGTVSVIHGLNNIGPGIAIALALTPR